MRELEEVFKVKELSLGIKKFGWGAAKVHALLSDKFPGRRVLLLDADIFFAGKFLEGLYQKTAGYDFVVSAEYVANPTDDYVTRTYFDYQEVKKNEPEYEYPGFLFNTGQLIVKTGLLHPADIATYFNDKVFPFYLNMKVTPLVDQSILNIILVKKLQKKEITLSQQDFMLWSDGEVVQQLKLEDIKKGDVYPYLVHYAGSFKNISLVGMKRADLLDFFESYYYSKIPNGNIKHKIRYFSASSVLLKKRATASAKAFVVNTPLDDSLKKVYRRFN